MTGSNTIKHAGHCRDVKQRGRPPKLDERAKREMVRTARATPFNILGSLAVENGVSIDTARRTLDKIGLNSYIPRHKPLLSAANIAARLRWIQETIHTDFKKVLYTDESAFRVGDTGRRRVIRAKGEAYLPQHINPVFRRGATLHVWGAIYHGHKFPLVRFELAKARREGGKTIAAQTITSDVYMRQILAGPLNDYVRSLQQEGHAVSVVEDGAPVHTATQVKTLRQVSDFPTQFHPPSSPDLNPIENCWAILKHRICSLPTHPTSADELWQAVQRLWDEMEQEIHDRAIESMTRRREDLKRVKGYAVRG